MFKARSRATIIAAEPQPTPWPDLRQRSLQPELMDAPELVEQDPDLLVRTLKEIDRINQLLGGHRCTLQELAHLLGGQRQRSWRILDVGCGSGDSLRQLARWGKKNGYRLELSGLDLQPLAIDLARELSAHDALSRRIQWVCADYRDYTADCDIVISSLFCHHLDNIQLDHFIGWLRQRASYGFVINDLQRHALAYQGIRWLTRWFSRSAMARYDAPLSVWRAFHRQELQAAFAAHGLHPQITWHWAFRYGVRGFV